MSCIYLGNVSVEEMEQRLGIVFKEEERKLLKDNRQEKADNIAKGKWHCFDIPFIVACGDENIQKEIIKIFTPYASKFKEKIGIGIDR